ncbi:16386_t:CDS:2, partial [Gigaspora rosea]
PLQLQKIIKDYFFEKPNLSSTVHTQPEKTWTTFHTFIQDEGEKKLINQDNSSVNSDKDLDLINSENTTNMDIDAPSRSHSIFVLGWAPQENLKVNQKDPVKQLTEKVKELLGQREIEYQDVPKVSTIANWIKRTSRAVKQSMALQFLERTKA